MIEKSLFWSVIDQALIDIKDFFMFSKPDKINSLVATSKKSPTCPILDIEKWHPSNISNAFSLFLNNEDVFLDEFSYWNLEDILSFHYNSSLSGSQVLIKLFKANQIPLAFPLFNLSIDLHCFKKRKEFEINEKLQNSNILNVLIKHTFQREVTWIEENYYKLYIPPSLLENKKDFKISDCFYTTLEDSHYVSLILEKDCEYDNDYPVLKAKKYRQYFLLKFNTYPFSTNSMYKFLNDAPVPECTIINSAGRLLKFILMSYEKELE